MGRIIPTGTPHSGWKRCQGFRPRAQLGSFLPGPMTWSCLRESCHERLREGSIDGGAIGSQGAQGASGHRPKKTPGRTHLTRGLVTEAAALHPKDRNGHLADGFIVALRRIRRQSDALRPGSAARRLSCCPRILGTRSGQMKHRRRRDSWQSRSNSILTRCRR